MSFVAESNASLFNSNNTQTGTMPAGLTTGDYIFCATSWGNAGGAGATVTAADVTMTRIGTTHQGSNDTVDFWMAPYDASLTLVWNSSTNDWCVWQIVGFRGLSGSFTFQQLTAFAGSQPSSPVSMSITGGTANASDDLIVLWGLNPGGNGDWTYNNGTCTAGTFTNLPLNVNSQNAQVGVQYLNACSGGATGNLTFTGTSGANSTDWVGLFLAASQLGPTINTQPASQTVYSGNTATFSVSATGSGTITYQWKLNGSNIGGATSSSYTTGTLSYSDNGSIFAVVVTDSNGSTTSANALLTVPLTASLFWIKA